MIKTALFILTLIFLAVPASAKPIIIDREKSAMMFSGTHAGQAFEGAFTQWEADVSFDDAKLDDSYATFRFDAASARTGNKMYDGTLPAADWFNATEHPEITFIADRFERAGDNAYIMTGRLTIRGITHEESIPYSIESGEDGLRKARADFTIDRLKYEIGVQSDFSAEWVSRMIDVNVMLAEKQADGE